ncbi:hypothetical protein AVEN_268740-1 [Araneus ventricosus]|uniref:Uncharacterized protein n=1 Tax=Araneus ventricosus TaxID=182803 RepID=A0A4Y2H0G6_ARAVE|nr:hypothetical protein AVEN_268740-1 [Araneus ventricosus]
MLSLMNNSPLFTGLVNFFAGPFVPGLVGVYMGTLSMPIDEAAETPKCSPGTSNTVSPFDISPVPNIKKRTTTLGRKATRYSLINGTPYKDQLTKSLEKSAPKKT